MNTKTMKFSVVQECNAVFKKIKKEIDANPSPFIIAADGKAGSGKTYFTEIMASEFKATIFRTDDFYLPVSLRGQDPLQVPAAHMDLQRFMHQVLIPAAKGKEVLYRAYDCRKDCFAPDIKITANPVIIVEGSYALHPALTPFYGYKLFFTALQSVQYERILERSGEDALETFKSLWIPAEELYFKHFCIKQKADLVIDTSKWQK